MSEEEAIKQIEDLILDRESFIQNDKEYDDIFLKDIQALKTVLQLLEQKDNKKNKLINKLKETIKEERAFMKDLEHKNVAFHYANGRETLSKEILKILEE